MTIAAGVLCSDGIIVCADTEHTGDVSKFQAQKIIAIDDQTFLTGAGATDYILMTADKLKDEFKSGRPVNPTDARQIVETVVRGVHDEHIFSFWDGSDPNRPGMELIVATRCSGGELALIKTFNSATHLGSSFEFAGSGYPIFEYWCRYFHRDRITMDGMTVLALFMLKEVKKVHPGCGGQSQIFYLPKAIDRPKRLRFFDEKDLLLGFPDNIVKMLSACFFEDTPGDWVEMNLMELCAGIRRLYKDKTWSSIPESIHQDVIKPTDSRKSEGQQ
jgi:20S proteasome alpha/beta subunit